MSVKKYKKKPVVIEAIQFTEETKDMCFNFVRTSSYPCFENSVPVLKIQTLEGDMIARFGDYIIKGVRGEFYPCRKDIFEETYEEV